MKMEGLRAAGAEVILITMPTAHPRRGVPGRLIQKGYAPDASWVLEKHRLYNDVVRGLARERGWRLIDIGELAHYRDLLVFLVWRDIKVLYAQTILGFSWAILNPAVQILVFSIIFGRVAQIPTDGIPYALFSTVAIV